MTVDVSKITYFALFKPDLLYNPILILAFLVICFFEINWVTVLIFVIVVAGQII